MNDERTMPTGDDHDDQWNAAQDADPVAYHDINEAIDSADTLSAESYYDADVISDAPVTNDDQNAWDDPITEFEAVVDDQTALSYTDDEQTFVDAMKYGDVPPMPDEIMTAAASIDDPIPTAPRMMERVLDFLGVRPDASRRLYSLTHAITIAPEAMVNYVLRGELYLARKQYALAADDFEKALTLAEIELTTDDDKSLGVVAQGVQDRALVGYEDALRYSMIGYNKHN